VLRKLLFLKGNKVREGTVGSDAGASRYEYQPLSAIEIENSPIDGGFGTAEIVRLVPAALAKC